MRIDCAPGQTCRDNRCEAAIVGRAYYGAGTVRFAIDIDDGPVGLTRVDIMAGDTVISARAPRVESGGRTHLAFHDHWPLAARPDELRVVDQEGELLARLPVEDQGVKALGEPCLRNDPSERCAAGGLCLSAAQDCAGGCRSLTGTCRPVEVRAWRGDGRIYVDVEANRPIHQSEAFSIDHKAVEYRLLRQDLALPEGRWLGQWQPAVDGPVDVHHWGNRIADGVEVRDRERRAVGEPCDPARVRTYCAGEAVCAAGQCLVPSAPIIDEAVVVQLPGVLGVWVRGRDADNDVSRVRVIVGERTHNLRPGTHFRDPWRRETLEVANGQFEIGLSLRLDDIPAEPWGEVAVEVVDHENLSDVALVNALNDPSTQRPLGALGADCDPLHALWPCADGLRCDVPDDRPDAPLACQPTTPECPGDLAIALAEGAPRRIIDRSAPLESYPLCVRNAGQNERRTVNYFSFVAPSTGQYRIQVEAQGAFGLTVRRACLLPYSEMACAGFEVVSNPPAMDAVTVELLEGEHITPVVESSRDFQIRVDLL